MSKFNSTLFSSIGVITIIVLFTQCKYDVAEELYPPDMNTCDTINVSFSATVFPVVQDFCITCHNASNNSGGVNLDGYDMLIGHVQSGAFLGTITHDDNYSPMPQDADKLGMCTIQKIESWIEQGALNN